MASGGRMRTTTLFDFGVVRLQKAASPTDGESNRADEIADGATAATVLAYHDDDNHDHDDNSDGETDISTVAAKVEQQENESEMPDTDSGECNSDCCKANREQPNQPI